MMLSSLPALNRAALGALPIADMQSLLWLFAQLAEAPNDRVVRTEALVRGLMKVLDSDVGMIVQFENYDRHTPIPRHIWGIDFGFRSEVQRAVFFSSLRDPDGTIYPVADRCRDYPEVPVAVTRQNVVSDSEWYEGAFFQRYVSKAGVDHSLTVIYPLSKPGSVLAVGLHRWLGRAPHSERDRLLAQLAIDNLGWFIKHLAVPERPVERPLSTRLKRCLEHLLAGQSEKQVARSMGISPQSVHEYVKQLYKHHGVNSRAELLARVLEQPSAPHKEAEQEGKKTTGRSRQADRTSRVRGPASQGKKR